MNIFFCLAIVAALGLGLLIINHWRNPADCNEENSGKLPGIVGAILASALIVAGLFGFI